MAKKQKAAHKKVKTFTKSIKKQIKLNDKPLRIFGMSEERAQEIIADDPDFFHGINPYE